MAGIHWQVQWSCISSPVFFWIDWILTLDAFRHMRKGKKYETQIMTGFEHKSEQDLNTNHNRIWTQIITGFGRRSTSRHGQCRWLQKLIIIHFGHSFFLIFFGRRFFFIFFGRIFYYHCHFYHYWSQAILLLLFYHYFTGWALRKLQEFAPAALLGEQVRHLIMW